MPAYRRSHAAFTLMELLIVIAVLAVLAAILFPVFAQARERARQSACLSNMRQMGLAFAQYLSDYDGQYPSAEGDRLKITGRPPDPSKPGEDDGDEERDWHILLQPYLKNLAVLRCPSDTSKAPADPSHAEDDKGEYVSSYAINAWAEFDLGESQVKKPTEWILLGERNNATRSPKTWWLFYWWAWQGTNVWPPAVTPDPTPKAQEDLDLARHNNMPNWLYADGHVKSAALSQLWKAGADNPFWPTP